MKETISRWLQYAYFLRFCIVAFFFLPALCWLDQTTAIAILSRGIMTVESGWQAFFAAFFIVAFYMTVLITARNILRNGDERFITEPPPVLRKIVQDDRGSIVWMVLLVAHLPSPGTLLYVGCNAIREGQTFSLVGTPGTGARGLVWVFLAFGVVAAGAFWYLVSLFYYWIYKADSRRAAALIFPADELCRKLEKAEPPPRLGGIAASTLQVLRLTLHGYSKTTSGPFYELHVLSAIAILGFWLLYLFLYPFTAPVARANALHFGTFFAAALAGLFLYLIAGTPEKPAPAWVKHIFQSIALAPVLIFVFNLLAASKRPDYEPNFLAMAFPALASILVILTFMLWLFTGLSFFFDRYRVPVLTLALLALFLANVGGPREHYYAASENRYLVAPPTPAEILNAHVPARLPLNGPHGEPIDQPEPPAIIVTAAGGGIHAAYWTASLLAELEKSFDRDSTLAKSGYTFHGNLLLASSVSGGSNGMLPFLLEYSAPDDVRFKVETDDQWNAFRTRISNPPACSALEAITWGLEYYDMYRLLFGGIRVPTGFPEGEAPDRSWALAAAFNRNLRDRHCTTEPLPELPGGPLTLGHAAAMLAAKKMPAFVFNATAAETGGRFLFSNYGVPNLGDRHADFLPAESFLNTYGGVAACQKPIRPADVSLAVAARLGATFPYVTSGTRLPTRFNPYAFHFLDGGYYDNDGTASIIEFLHSALVQQQCPDGTNSPKAGPPARPKRNILLIEIRDGIDVPSPSPESLTAQDLSRKSWTILDQLTAPPVALWGAGHESISRRNRRELCLLETAYQNQISIHHVVFTIDPQPKQASSKVYQPLNWNLTAKQRKSIDEWIDSKDDDKSGHKLTANTINSTVRWVATMLTHPDNGTQPVNPPPCQVVDEP